MIVNIALIPPRLSRASLSLSEDTSHSRAILSVVCCPARWLAGWVVSSPLQSSLAQWLIQKTQLGGSQLNWWLLSTGRQNG